MKSTHSKTQGPAIEVRDLRKSYGEVEAIRGISFEVGSGEVFCLLGPNGAGKTTTVEILEGYGCAAAARSVCSGATRRRVSASSATASGSSSNSAACSAT